MNFVESVEYLMNLGNEVLAMKLGLENITKLLNALNNPHNKYLKIQIAGTNGKGSTCAFLEAICLAAKIKVGMTTSPHLVSITERVRINGANISEKEFARLATTVRETSEELVKKSELETVPTYFEQVTAIALLAFAENKIELAILETGLGGRFDATTAANAEICALTRIDYDHQQYLGETLAEIASEKAAIIHRNSKAVIAPQNIEAEKVIAGKCREVGVEPTWTSSQIAVKKHELKKTESFLSANFKTEKNNYHDVVLGLRGRHQLINASLAISIAETLNDFDFKISADEVRVGLETAKHSGRLELHKGILFDGAHNVAGAKALREYLDEFVSQPLTIIFGAMSDKNISEIAEIIFPKAENLILTEPDNPRSLKTSELLKFIPREFKGEVFEVETVSAALEKASEILAKNGLILITGSLYLVGEAQKILSALK